MRSTIDTPRLSLRAFRDADASRVTELVGAWDVARMLARVPHPYKDDNAKGWIATHDEARANARGWHFAIATTSDGVIGAMSLERRDDDEPLTLGYWLGEPYWGLGYATEAGAALLAYASDDLGETTFRSEHFIDNDASGRVLRKLDFAYTGEVRRMQCVARGEKVQARMMRRPGEAGGDHG